MYARHQLTVLRLVRVLPSVEQLIGSAPNLVWLAADQIDKRRVQAADIRVLMAKKRKAILGWCIARSAGTTDLKFLNKFVAGRRGESELAPLRQALARPEIASWFRHFRDVHPADVRTVLSLPALRRYPFLRDVILIGRTRTDAPGICLELVRDVRLLGNALGRDDVEAVLAKVPTMSRLKGLHDRWYRRLNLHRAVGFGAWVKILFGTGTFPVPPLPGTDTIIPIRTVDELLAEGEEMDHCVGSYAQGVFTGECFIYKVLSPQRATLELSPVWPTPALAQLKLKGNEEPAPECWQAVERWLVAQPHG
jgi:hypothetical protein